MWIIVLWSCIKIKRRGEKIKKKMLMRCRTVPQVLKVGSPHVPEPAVESLSIVSQRGRFSFLTSHIRILYTLSQVLILNVLLPALIYRKTTVKSMLRSPSSTHHTPPNIQFRSQLHQTLQSITLYRGEGSSSRFQYGKYTSREHPAIQFNLVHMLQTVRSCVQLL